MKKLIAYIRVSTREQGDSGLGLEAQVAAINAYATMTGGSVVMIYREVESGKNCNRPQIKAALSHAKCIGATLVVAKLDRLARNVAFTSSLMEAGVDFICCDNPHANRLTIHILAAVAEDEAIRISERTKAALKAYKARGGLLGGQLVQCRRLTPQARERGIAASIQVRKQAATEAYTHLMPIINELRTNGATLDSIAQKLNTDGYTTRRGKQFSATQIMRIIER